MQLKCLHKQNPNPEIESHLQQQLTQSCCKIITKTTLISQSMLQITHLPRLHKRASSMRKQGSKSTEAQSKLKLRDTQGASSSPRRKQTKNVRRTLSFSNEIQATISLNLDQNLVASPATINLVPRQKIVKLMNISNFKLPFPNE